MRRLNLRLPKVNLSTAVGGKGTSYSSELTMDVNEVTLLIFRAMILVSILTNSSIYGLCKEVNGFTWMVILQGLQTL